MAKEPDLRLTEDEDLARARVFWQDHGRPIVAGVLLGILGIGGWNGWHYWQKSEGESASTLYQNISRDGIELTTAASIVEDLFQDYPDSPYAVNGALVMAKKSMDKADFVEAGRYLKWAVENARDDVLVHIARLRLAQVALASGSPEEALAILAEGGSAVEEGPFAARYQELVGDAQVGLGHEDEARKAWESSLALLEGGSSSALLVQLKLDNLGTL